MKIIHQNGYTTEELLAFRPLIWKNLLESAHAVINALAKIGLEPIMPLNKVHPHLSLSSVYHSSDAVVCRTISSGCSTMSSLSPIPPFSSALKWPMTSKISGKTQ